jgi:hypothetical protein
MTSGGFVPEAEVDERLVQMLSDPAHFRPTEMAVVDYSQPLPDAAPLGWEPLLSAKPEPEPPAGWWARLKAALRGAA